MLTVSAAMLVSSTFAWFSLNRNVSASTMTVQAKSADPYLQISADNGTTWANELTSGTNWNVQSNVTINGNQPTAARLKLIAPKEISATPTWVWNKSDDVDDANTTAVTDATNKAVTLEEKAANKTDGSSIMTGKVAGEQLEDAFVLKQVFQFKNVSKSAVGTNLKIDSVSITRDTAVADPASDFDKAVRVLVVNAAGEYALYDGNGANIAAENGATGTRMGDATNHNVILGTLPVDGTTSITVYMYFDGNASQAKTSNAFDLTGVHAEFHFSIDSETATNA